MAPYALGQSRGLWTCGGRCGKPACAFVTTNATRIKYHLQQKLPPGNRRVQCLLCRKVLTRRSLRKHYRIYHPDRQASKKRRRLVILPCPVPHDRPGWNFVKHKIRLCIANDFRAMHRWSAEDQSCVRKQHASNHTIHAIAKKTYARWKAMRHLQDDAGGNPPGGTLLLRRHALFQLSLDRIDNTRPHFVRDALSNLNLVPLGLNTPKGVVGRWGKYTCRRLRACVAASNAAVVSNKTVSVLQRARGAKDNMNVAYRSTRRAYRADPKTRRQFLSPQTFFEYALSLLEAQKGRCAVSGIFMDEGPHTPKSRAFQPSLDAISPTLGHVRGNLRWICCFLNSANQNKQKSSEFNTPQLSVHTVWTPTLFRAYVGVT